MNDRYNMATKKTDPKVPIREPNKRGFFSKEKSESKHCTINIIVDATVYTPYRKVLNEYNPDTLLGLFPSAITACKSSNERKIPVKT